MEQVPENEKFENKTVNFERIDKIWIGNFNEARIIKARSGVLALATDIGIGRARNEDAIVINTEQDAFAVIDGMGGYAHGDIAAKILAEEIQQGFNKNISFELVQKFAAHRLKENGMTEDGACYVAMHIKGRELFISRAGDVQIAIVEPVHDKVKFLSKTDGSGSQLTNAVCGIDAGKTHTEKIQIRVGDRIYIASDGFWGNIDIQKSLEENKRIQDVSEALKNLYETAIAKMKFGGGNPDNISLMIYDVSFPNSN